MKLFKVFHRSTPTETPSSHRGLVFFPQVAVHVRNEGGAGSDVRVSAGTGQKGGTDSSASGRSGALDPGGVRTLSHEDNQLGGESQSRLCLHQLLGRAPSSSTSSLSLCTLPWTLRGWVGVSPPSPKGRTMGSKQTPR